MAHVTLFDNSSVSPTSRFFYIDYQLTIVAIGMPAGDFITFEVVESNPAARVQNCGCDLLPPGKISMAAVQELTCPSCVGSPRPVTLTAANPVTILDYPQGFFIRAIYNGDGLQDGLVTVKAFDSQTHDVTPEMRGCPPICCEDSEERIWEPTGVHRCNLADNTYEERERSNCGEFRWVLAGPLTWSETNETRCVGETVQTRYVNQCGNSEWRDSGTVIWNETNETRCVGETVQTRYVNQCGTSEWRDSGTVVWNETSETRCVADRVQIRYTNQCGISEWRDSGPVTWSDTGDVRCVGGNVEAKQTNECGRIQWVDRGPATWSNTTTTRCHAGQQQVFQQSSCGETRWSDTGLPCNTYIATLELFCGARAYRPTDPRDPAATVPLQGCCDDEDVIGYIYPTPRVGATTAVTTSDCADCETNEVLGYAVDWPNNLTCCSC